jgi:hypothetical protein
VLRRLARCLAGLGSSVVLLLPAAGASASDTGGHEFHRHHLGVFLGGASRPEEHGSAEHDFAGGVDCEHRLSQWVGVGLLAEAATADLRDAVVTGMAFVHPWKGLPFAAGAGAEISSHHTEFFARLGVAYQFPIRERFTLAPNFNVDLVHGDPTYLYGITLGIGF